MRRRSLSGLLLLLLPFALGAGYPAPPADPQLVSSHALAGSLQSLVLFDNGTDLPRNLCTNSLPRTWAGTSGVNFGPAPIWRPTDFTPDATPSAAIRFASNSRSLAYPGSGICPSLVRDSNTLDLTYFGIFAVDAVDASASPQPLTIPIICNGQGVYGNYGTDSTAEDGLAIYLPGGGSGSASANLVWKWQNSTLRNCDSTGATNLCPIIAGHWYFAAVSVGGAYGAGACHFYLYDLTSAGQVSPTGDQYFTDSSSVRTNDRYPNWIPGPIFTNYAEQTICSAGGAVVRMRLAGLDNRLWTDAIGAAWVANPYAMLTGSRTTGGTPPTSLIATALGTGTYDGGPLTANGTSTTGAYPAKVVYLGDSVVSRVTESAVTVVASAPLGANSITTWNLYGGTTSPSLTGTPLATGTSPSFTYNPPDAGLRFYQVTATTGGTTYAYPILPIGLRSRPAVSVIKAGNSINTITGSITSTFQTAGAVANAAGFDFTVSTQGVEGQYGVDWINASVAHNFFGPTTSGGAVITNPRDFMLARAAQELAATGQPVYASLQLAGNSSNFTTAQYSQVCSALLAGTGQQANYTPAITSVFLAAPPLQVAGHSASENLALITSATTNSIAAAAANPTHIKVTGLGAQAASITYPSSSKGSHPDPFIAMVEGFDDVKPFLPVAAGATSTDPGVGNVKSGTAYQIAGTSLVGTYDPVAGNYTDVGAANVVAPATYKFAGQTKSGTYTPPVSTDPGAANVKLGTTYTIAGSGLTGSYDPVTGQYTDPGAAHVQSGTSYKFAGTTIPGTLVTSSTSSGISDADAQKIASAIFARTDVEGTASGRTLAQTLRAIFASTAGIYDTASVPGSAVFKLPTGQEQFRYTGAGRTNVDTSHAVSP